MLLSILIAAVVVLLLIGVIGGLSWLSNRLGGQPYKKVDALLSEAERSFFGVLCQSVGPNQLVFVKVRMIDLLSVPKGVRKRQRYVNQIMSKHVDFVVCDAVRMTPLVAIELDDRSHDAARRRERDALVDRAFLAAGLPLVHVRAKRSYVHAEIEALVRDHTSDFLAGPKKGNING